MEALSRASNSAFTQPTTQAEANSAAEASSAAPEDAPSFEEMDRAFTRVENRFNRLCRFRCCCDPTAKRLTPAERVLRRAIFNSAIHVTCSALAFAGWFFNRPRGIWQLVAAVVQLVNCVGAATAATSLLIVWCPGILKLVKIMERTLRVSSPQEADDFGEAADEFVLACDPKRRMYIHAYRVCCVLALAAWVGHVPYCVAGVCQHINFGFASIMNAVVTVTSQLQVQLCLLYERRRRSVKMVFQLASIAGQAAPNAGVGGDAPAELQPTQSREQNAFL